MPSAIFHSYEYLLLKNLDNDSEKWQEVKEYLSKDKPDPVQIPSNLWFLSITLEKTKDRFPTFLKSLIALKYFSKVPTHSESLLTRYLNHFEFVEFHLDSIFKYRYLEESILPRELFHCPNLKVLSLKYNFLESLPACVGRLQKLEYLGLTGNRLQNYAIPRSLVFCRNLRVLLLDDNLLDALPGFLLQMPSLQTVHRHGNHNYFKATFMWYHTDFNDRILAISGSQSDQSLNQNEIETVREPPPPQSPAKLQFLSAQTVIGTKMNIYHNWSNSYFSRNRCKFRLPDVLVDYVSDMYPLFNICGNCNTAKLQDYPGYKVFTFKNPFLGNTCVPFQHWACSLQCAEAIEIPARVEQMFSAMQQDIEYKRYIQAAQESCPSCGRPYKGGKHFSLSRKHFRSNYKNKSCVLL